MGPRRRLAPVVALVVLAASGVAPGVAPVAARSGPGLPGSDRLTGTLLRTIADDFTGRQSSAAYALETPAGPVRLHLAAEPPRAAVGGSVTVTGTFLAPDEMAVPDGGLQPASRGGTAVGDSSAGSGTASPRPVGASPLTVDTHRVAVVLANLTGVPAAPVTLDQATAVFNGASGSVKQFYETASRGRASMNATVYGPWTIAKNPCTSAGYDAWGVFSALDSAMAAHGVSAATFDHIVIWTGEAPCAGFSGLASTPGTHVIVNFRYAGFPEPYVATEIAAHELGHNLGLEHANALYCYDSGGVLTSLSGDCSSDEYGDTYSAMGIAGYAPYPLLHGEELRELGWLDTTETRTVTSGTYTLVPTYSTTAGTRLIRIPRPANGNVPAGYLTLEIRSRLATNAFDQFAPTDRSSPVISGVTVRLAVGDGFEPSELVDTTPNSGGGVWDAPLQPGRTLVDALGHISIRVNAAGSGSASVTIGVSGPPGAPTGAAAEAGAGEAWVSWKAPLSSGGSAITGYTVTSSPDGRVCTTTGALGCMVTGLTNGTSYTFTVTAKNATETGPASDPTPAVTPSAGPPGVPRSVTATASSRSITLKWSAPAVDGGAPITGYTASAFPGSGRCQSTTALTCTLGGLTNGTPYLVVLVAENEYGSGDPAYLEGLAPTAIVRFAGPDRFATAAMVSKKTFTDPATVDAVYVAYAFNFPDALAGAAAAGTVHGPVLLAGTTGPLNPSTASELTRLHPKKIVVLGSEGVIGADVFDALKGYSANVVRYFGPDRFATAADVSKKTFTDPATVDAVYIAYAFNFPDALAGAAAAGTVHGPVLLAGTTGPLSPSTVSELTRLHPKKIVVLGSEGVIGHDVFLALGKYSSVVVRYSGASRYGTAADVSAKTFVTPASVRTVYVACGSNFPDALAGAAAAGFVPGPVLLAPASGALDATTIAELTRLRPTRIVVLGSTGVISTATAAALDLLAGP